MSTAVGLPGSTFCEGLLCCASATAGIAGKTCAVHGLIQTAHGFRPSKGSADDVPGSVDAAGGVPTGLASPLTPVPQAAVRVPAMSAVVKGCRRVIVHDFSNLWFISIKEMQLLHRV
jgi:hypothetical protein